MTKTIKALLVALTAFSFTVANAGDLTITGNAKASYSIASSDASAGSLNRGKGLGVSNEFTLSASGELDNGYSWSYAQDIDGTTTQDDAKLTLTMGSLGTVGVFVSEGGLDTDNTASQSVLSRPSDTSYNEGMFDTFDLSGMNTLQYHMPADLLPFGIVGKIAYAPNPATSAPNADFKATGTARTATFTESSDVGNTASNPFAQTSAMGKSATHYQVKAAPIDGLAIGADYVDYSGVESATSGQSLAQSPESGSYYATYAFGPATFGYSKSYVAFAIGNYAQDNTESVEGSKYSVAFNVNDDLSISYENEESNPDNQTAATTNLTMESTGIQAAYTMGGMTLAIAMNDHENVNYTDNKDVKDTVFTVAMAF